MQLKKKNTLSSIVSIICALCLFVVFQGNAQVANFEKWAKHNPDEQTAINHTPMSSILKFATVGSGRKTAVDYTRLGGDALNYVKQYKAYLEGIPVTLLNRDEQLAYWLNLYNAAVIEKLASNVRSLKRIKEKRGIPGEAGEWWSEKLVTVENTPLSLEDIEQNILIKHWQDPVILYGLFYGVKGSAFKGTEGFSGATVKAQLAGLATDFIGNSKNVKISKNKVQVSSLYAWNKATLFANDDAQLINHLRMYAKGDVADDLAKVEVVRDRHKFSWASNAHKRSRQITSGASAGGGGYAGGS